MIAADHLKLELPLISDPVTPDGSKAIFYKGMRSLFVHQSGE